MELTPELQEKKIFLIEGLKKTYKDQYDAIQPLPYVKDRLYCVDKVFVEGGVEVCLAPELTRGTGGSWERLESYKSIYTDFRFKSKRRIIQGEPGYGKSTLTLQLAYDWCNDVSDSPINNVEILILLRLRQLGSVKSLFRAIKMFLLFHEPRVSKHEIEKIINSCSSVHITLDGYDEYPGRGSNVNDDVHRIIKMELFAEFDVSLTTRYLPESLREETKRAKLTGFDDKARDEYIRKAVVGNNDEAVEKIKQWLYENSILADLCQVPLIFVMFAHMANDEREVIKFKSVTQFFKHIIRCFYDHLKRKRKLYDDRNNRFYLHEKEHHELDKIAFEGFKINQQLSWIKTEFRKRVGPESYDQYILIGILVEEDVVSDDSTGDNVLFTTMVRFYHKLFCEWYAAHHLVTVVKKAVNLFGTLRFLDPVDLQYLFRFACGLDPDAGKELINYLQSLPGGDTFAILCILEQTGDVNDIMDAVTDLCSRDVKIKKGDSALLQRSTTQLLEIASNNHIPISCLHLEYSAAIKFEGDTLILSSGIPLPILPTVEKIHIYGSNAQHDNTETLSGIFSHRQETLTEKDILNLFRYGMKCRCVKELMFSQLQLPTSVSPESFTDMMKTQNICVRWRPFDIDFHLDLQSGHWEVDDTQVLENIRSSTVSIDGSMLQQRSTVQLLHVAHRHNIPICSLLFNKTFRRADNGTIILNNGIQLTNLPQLEKIQVVDKDDCCSEITDRDIVNILLCAMKDQHFNVICFEGCLLPVSLSSLSFTNTMISRAINVSWCPFDSEFHLDLHTGLWEVDDAQVLGNICSSTVSINDTDSKLQQRSNVQLIHVSNNNNIPISCLHLEYSSIKIADNNIILHSGISLPTYPTVEKIHIAGSKAQHDNAETSFELFPYEHRYRRHGDAQSANQEILTENDMLNLFRYGMKCRCVKELMFDQLRLPTSVTPEAITNIIKTWNIRVRWRPFDIDFHLDLQNGHWEVDDIQVILNKNSGTVSLSERNNKLQDTSTLQLLEVARNHNIPVSCLHLEYSSIKFEGDTIKLHSGIPLPILPAVEKIHIAGSYAQYGSTGTLREKHDLNMLPYRNPYQQQYEDEQDSSMESFTEMENFDMHLDGNQYLREHNALQVNPETLTDKDILNLFRYGMKCGRVKELMFNQFQLPTSVSPEAFTDKRKIQVRWRPFDIRFHLDLETGHWEVDNNDTDTLRQLCSDTVHIRNSDDIFKQKYTIMFIHTASSHEIPISCLNLYKSFRKIDAGSILLYSGLRLSCPVSVKKVEIDAEEGREMTEREVVDILMFVQQSHMLEELEFDPRQMPTSFSPEAFTDTMKTRNIQVRWRPFDIYLRLDLETGHWEVDDTDTDTLCQLCSDTVHIRNSDDIFKQKYTIMFIHTASSHEVQGIEQSRN